MEGNSTTRENASHRSLSLEDVERAIREIGNSPRPRFIVTDMLAPEVMGHFVGIPHIMFIGVKAWEMIRKLLPLDTSQPELALLGIQVEFHYHKKGEASSNGNQCG